MPCTRDRHCNPDGQCNANPHCQEPGAVWTGQTDDSGTECSVDDDCATEPVKTQCGYRLFNLENAVDNPGNLMPAPRAGTIVLDAKIVGGGAHKRRGACKTNPTNACGNGNGPAACTQGDCRGYQLRAGPVQ